MCLCVRRESASDSPRFFGCERMHSGLEISRARAVLPYWCRESLLLESTYSIQFNSKIPRINQLPQWYTGKFSSSPPPIPQLRLNLRILRSIGSIPGVSALTPMTLTSLHECVETPAAHTINLQGNAIILRYLSIVAQKDSSNGAPHHSLCLSISLQ